MTIGHYDLVRLFDLIDMHDILQDLLELNHLLLQPVCAITFLLHYGCYQGDGNPIQGIFIEIEELIR